MTGGILQFTLTWETLFDPSSRPVESENSGLYVPCPWRWVVAIYYLQPAGGFCGVIKALALDILRYAAGAFVFFDEQGLILQQSTSGPLGMIRGRSGRERRITRLRTTGICADSFKYIDLENKP